MNSVNLIGRLVRDPHMETTDDGEEFCTLRMAIDDIFSKEDRADFVNVKVYGTQARVCIRYLRKGFLAGVTGHIRSDVEINDEGVKRYSIYVIAERVQILQWPTRDDKTITPCKYCPLREDCENDCIAYTAWKEENEQ